MSGTTETDFPSWLDRQLAERGWEVSDLAREAGISASIIFRWRKNYRPNIANARAVARAFGVPLLEVLVTAGQITPEEAHANVSLPPSITDIDSVELTRELHRRETERQERLNLDERSVRLLAEAISRAPSDTPQINRRGLERFQRDLQRELEKHGRERSPHVRRADEIEQARQRIHRGDPPSTPEELPPIPEGVDEPRPIGVGHELVFDTDHGKQRFVLYPVEHSGSTPDESDARGEPNDHTR